MQVFCGCASAGTFCHDETEIVGLGGGPQRGNAFSSHRMRAYAINTAGPWGAACSHG